MLKNSLKVFAIMLMAIFCTIGIVYAEDNVATKSNTKEVVTITNNDNAGLFKMLVSNSLFTSSQLNVIRPYINVISESAVFDSNITSFGINFVQKDVTIDGDILGTQVIFAKDKITVNGSMASGILVSYNTVVINGEVNSTLFVISPEVYINEKAKINADIFVIADKMTITGVVSKTVIGGISEKLDITGKVQGDLRITTQGQNINIIQDGVKGQMYFEVSEDIYNLQTKYPQAIVVVRNQEENNKYDILQIVQKGFINVLLCTLVAYLVISKNYKWYDKTINILKTTPAYVMILGFAGIVGAILVTFVAIMMFNIQLVGLGLVTIFVYVAYLIFVLVLSMFVLGLGIYGLIKGKLNLDGKNEVMKKLGTLLVIYTIIYVLANISYIAWIVGLLMSMFSAGFVLIALFKKAKQTKTNSK